MPKIIQNVKQQLLSEAKRQIAERGYSNTTVRSVASGCGVGVGTVYNYFPSKDMMIATFMLKDWQECIHDVSVMDAKDAKLRLEGIYGALKAFSKKYAELFKDKGAAKVFMMDFSSRHVILRDQIAELIIPVCNSSKVENTAFHSVFIAEALITWSMNGADFNDVWSIIKNGFN